MSAEPDGRIAQPPMPWQQRCIAAATQILPDCPGVRAVWVGGSLARGEGDQFSDVDLNCLVSKDSLEFWRHRWSDVISELVGPLTMARTINDSIIGGFSVTRDWEHVDLIVHQLETFVRPAAYHVLYDPARLVDSAPSRPVESDKSMSAGDMSEFFFYLTGSFATLIGRGELTLAQNSVLSLRQWLIQLMFVENGRKPIGGARRLNNYLTAEQQEDLEKIGMILDSPQQISASAAKVFYSFAGRAKQLTVIDGSTFPEPMFHVAERHLRRTLGKMWPSPDQTGNGRDIEAGSS